MATNNISTDLITSAASGQQEFEDAILASLDMGAWEINLDQSGFYEQIGQRVYEAVKQEVGNTPTIRDRLLSYNREKLPFSGIQTLGLDDIRKAHNGLLFNGGVTAVDGTRITHDTLPITITQIGICLVNYSGNYGSYMHRLFQRDIQFKGEDPVQEVFDLLEARKKRSGQGIDEEDAGRFSVLAQRGLMAYAERAILMERAQSLWRMGHGHPFPYEMFVNFWASKIEITQKALALMAKIVNHKRFVFVPSSPSKHLITLGNALEPLEFVLIDTVKAGLEKIVENGNARGDKKEAQQNFIKEYGDEVVVGLFKCSAMSPAHVFYAHRDHAHTAALIAIADGILQEHRGFPMLIDLADQICHSTFHPETFFASVRQAYADAGQPFRFLGERETRNR